MRYLQQFERIDDDRETLQVGTTWHKAFDAASKKAKEIHPPNPHQVRGDPACDGAAYQAIAKHAPSPVWIEKLRRLFGGYRWRWAGQELEIIESEHQFTYVDADGRTRRGQIDGVVKIDNAIGNLERKTSGEDLDDGSNFWLRQRMGPQVSFYGNAFKALTGAAPAFTLYDVVRKPTIRAKMITKKDMARLRAELDRSGSATYHGQTFGEEDVEAALAEGRETIEFYGARLTADIMDRPDWYFVRKPIPRTTLDLQLADRDTSQTIGLIEYLSQAQETFEQVAGAGTSMFPRNPDSCSDFGLCDFFGLCSNGEYPGPDVVPDGFARREHLHPELEEATS